MRYIWRTYTAGDAVTVDGWMDDEARYFTGCDDGWDAYITDMTGEDNIRPGENFFCRVIWDRSMPIAAVALFLEEDGTLFVSELVIRPDQRGQGHGRMILRELLTASDAIFGCAIRGAEAVIYPNNAASIRAFESAGFHFTHAHPDGDVFYYRYEIPDTDE